MRKSTKRRVQKSLLVDNEFLQQFGLAEYVDKVTKRLIQQNKTLYRDASKWQQGSAFEKVLSHASPFLQKGCRGDVVLAVLRTWKPDDKFDALIEYLEQFDKIYSVRIGPMIIVLLAWLASYKNKQNNFIKLIEKLAVRPNSDLESSKNGDSSQQSITQEKVDHIKNTIAQLTDARSFELLHAGFNLGRNANIAKFAKFPIADNNSRLLYTFDRRKSHRLASQGKPSDDSERYYFRQSIRSELTVHAEDFVNPQTMFIIFAMMYYSKYIPNVRLLKRNGDCLEVDKNLLQVLEAGPQSITTNGNGDSDPYDFGYKGLVNDDMDDTQHEQPSSNTKARSINNTINIAEDYTANAALSKLVRMAAPA